MELIYIILGLAVGGLITYLIVRPKLKSTIEKDWATQQLNDQLRTDNVGLVLTKNDLVSQVNQKKIEQARLHTSIDELTKYLEDMGVQAEQSAEAIRQLAMTKMQDSFYEAAEKEAEKYRKAVENFQTNYQTAMSDFIKDFKEESKSYKDKIAELNEKYSDLKKVTDAAIAANIREEEKKNNISFYTVGLSDVDIQEVKKIREVIPYLRNGRPIAKAIWECYYRNATNDLVNRVVGAGTHTGIYRITCLLDNKIYIGQARDIRERIIQHMKCGLGIDTTNAKLYAAMLKLGVENFSFEVVEECAAADLNKQEKYWIEFYHSNLYGYNMNSGGSRS